MMKLCRKELDAAGSTAAGAVNVGKVLELGVMIEGMYKRAIQYDELVEDIPAIATRLYTLGDVHQRAAVVVDTVTLIEQQLTAMQEEVINNQGVLNSIQESVTANRTVFEHNIQQV